MNPDPTLAELRQRLARMDDRLHELMIARTKLAAALHDAGEPARQPHHEAASLRRLADQHDGPLPFPVVARIWRELVAAAAHLARPAPVAVFACVELPGLSDLARAQYGGHAPVIGYRVAAQVVQAVADRTAAVGVLPLPQESERDPWWRLIVSRDPGVPRIVARLPFAGRGNARPGADAFAVALESPDAGVPDRTLLAIEFAPDMSRTRVTACIAAAGLEGRIIAVDAPELGCLALAEVAGDVAEDDARLAALASQLGGRHDAVHRVGGYAEPLATPANNANTPIRAAS